MGKISSVLFKACAKISCSNFISLKNFILITQLLHLAFQMTEKNGGKLTKFPSKFHHQALIVVYLFFG